MYFSTHRYDYGRFFPGANVCGSGGIPRVFEEGTRAARGVRIVSLFQSVTVVQVVHSEIFSNTHLDSNTSNTLPRSHCRV